MAQAIPTDYSSWSADKLIQRITDLEKELKHVNISSNHQKNDRAKGKPFDPTKYSTRLIAIKFAYIGKRFNGYEHSGNVITPLPTIEEELWKALMRTRLIFPHKRLAEGEIRDNSQVEYDTLVPSQDDRMESINWDGCNYSKCGRTDKGVSSFGQVMGIQVRSNRPLPPSEEPPSMIVDNEEQTDGKVGKIKKPAKAKKDVKDWDPIADEILYIHLLNQALPPEIRVLAWCPSPPPDFSARFSCRERRYKYFFTNPAFLPLPNRLGYRKDKDGNDMREGWLNLEKMKEAASYFIGKNDFRNFSKNDPVRQLKDYSREIFHVGIDEVSSLNTPSFLAAPGMLPVSGEKVEPKVYAFSVNGSAFLYHQVRHMIGMLFLVGQGLEEPSIVKKLLDVKTNPQKPNYEMASDVPLVLWDCVFPADDLGTREDALQWIYADVKTNGTGSRSGPTNGKWGQQGLMESLWTNWRSAKMEETLASLLMDMTAQQGTGVEGTCVSNTFLDEKRMRIFDGGDSTKTKSRHVPIMKRDLLEPVEVTNARWAEKKAKKVELSHKRSSDQMDE